MGAGHDARHETSLQGSDLPMMSAQQVPQDLSVVPYVRLRAQLQTGDIVLFSGHTLAARTVRWWTGSPWSHIGLIVRLPAYADTPLLWEATRASPLADIHSGQVFDGVQLVSLDAKLANYPGVVAVRRLLGLRRDRRERLCPLLEAWRAKPYCNLLRKNLQAWCWGEEAAHISRGGFCSELVAEVYKQLQLLPQDKPSIRYMPGDFAPDTSLSLLQGRLSPAYLLHV